MPQSRKLIFFALFFLSGFSGLIYQSIWSHYLKLFLGHAAYAQTLVLAIFMGGMAIGSLASGLSLHRWRKLLIGYALVEGIIGLMAILFHGVFVSVTDLTFTHLILGLEHSPFSVVAIKWGIASLLIFPQSVLLGMTFPLMVGGILRHFPERPGYTLSMLYFTNSFGAVFGVLASSFIFIGWFGLPGTMLTAGLLNIILSITVWSLGKNYIDPIHTVVDNEELPSHDSGSDTTQTPILPGTLLFIALMTGLSSFMYEIGWIRMLVLVLGGSTHSFELMLASFILGIALGGLWIRNRIDMFSDFRVFLGYVQIAMALAAILSLWMYHFSFDWMAYLLDSLQRKESTYGAYLFFSGLISVAIMLPATFCAGMTLPLITRLIIKTSKNENGVGYVYSANTLGAIIGIFISIHIIMPTLGLKNLIIIGAATDMALGIYLIGFIPRQLSTLPKHRYASAVAAVAVFTLSAAFVKFDINRLSSGVYRNGFAEAGSEIIFYGDGKTSTVTVGEYKQSSLRVITNNGKPDASVMMDPDKPRSRDESTQVLISAYPLFQKPDAKTAAVIGMGSGMSTQSLLSSSNIERVDTIEMEAKVLEGARLFMPANEKAYNDSRSNLYVEDAKTFFSSQGKLYDIIVSEPPNPWVSGVSTLFSQEFYSRIKRHLNEDGIFAQWIHLYEINIGLVATVFNALNAEFEDYVVYRTSDGDIVIMASANKKLESLTQEGFDMNSLKSLLSGIQINTFEDLEINKIGSKKHLAPLFRFITEQVNSDYFPILDSGAPKSRYAENDALELFGLMNASIPALNFLEKKSIKDIAEYSENPNQDIVNEKHKLLTIRDLLINSNDTDAAHVSTRMNEYFVLLDHQFANCGANSDDAIDALIEYSKRAVVLLTTEEQAPFWNYIENTQCFNREAENGNLVKWINLFKAISQHDYQNMSLTSSALLVNNKYTGNQDLLTYLLSVGMLGDAFQGDTHAAQQRWDKWQQKFQNLTTYFPLILLLSNIGIQI